MILVLSSVFLILHALFLIYYYLNFSGKKSFLVSLDSFIICFLDTKIVPVLNKLFPGHSLVSLFNSRPMDVYHSFICWLFALAHILIC